MLKRLKWKDFLLGSLFFIPAIAFVLLPAANRKASPPTLAGAGLDSLETPEAADTLSEPPPPRSFKVIGVGDIMLGTNYPSAGYLPANGGKDLLAGVEDILRDADVTFGNLEGTLLDKGGTAKRCKDPSLCYAFRSPERYVEHLVQGGFDVMSLANNHSGDFGPEGRRRTKAVLAQNDIAFAGLAGSDETALFERSGITYGFCAFAPNRGTCDIRNLDRARAIVTGLAEKADVVIVSFHGGAEGANHQHVPRRTETYYGENRGDVYRFAHAVIDAGADIVFGHGPHVTRALELYQDRLICYSLGNFCTYGRFNLRGAAGIAPIVAVEIDSTGRFLGGKLTPVYQEKTHGPKVDPQKRAINKVIALTSQDFPETPLLIEADGTLRKKP